MGGKNRNGVHCERDQTSPSENHWRTECDEKMFPKHESEVGKDGQGVGFADLQLAQFSQVFLSKLGIMGHQLVCKHIFERVP